MNKQFLLAARPQGMVKDTDFDFRGMSVPTITEGQILIKNEYISLDPAMRGWMNEGTTYIKGVEIGEVMRALGVGVVIESKNEKFKVGDAVSGLTGVQLYTITDGNGWFKIDTNAFPMSWYVGVLGMSGFTAYFGLLDKGLPKPGETILVSAAAGMVGSLVGQIGKIKGCKVIGIAGGSEKCKMVLDEFGFDDVIDYKATTNMGKSIREKAPNGIDIYFDNVGGDILDAALLNLARGARVVICGAISQYNDYTFMGLKNYMKILTARGTMTGLVVLDYYPRAGEALKDMGAWLNQGKIKYKEHMISGIENFPSALRMLFTGENKGKLLLKIS